MEGGGERCWLKKDFRKECELLASLEKALTLFLLQHSRVALMSLLTHSG